MGIDQFQLEDESTQDLIKQGNNLVTRQVQKRARQLNSSNVPQAVVSSAASSIPSSQMPRFSSQDQLINNQTSVQSRVQTNQSTTYGVNFFDE